MGSFFSKNELKEEAPTISNRGRIPPSNPTQDWYSNIRATSYIRPTRYSEADTWNSIFNQEQYRCGQDEEDLTCQLEKLALSGSTFKPQRITLDAYLVDVLLNVTGNDTYLDSSTDVYRLIELNDNSKEFKNVKQLFTSTNKRCFTIISIQQVHNPYLLLQYKLMKKSYQQRYGQANEISLFHGTKRINVDNICKYNFDWRRRGTSIGHRFGQGVSFTPIANYATHYGDKARRKVMILAHVLVNQSCQGDKDTVIPPFIYDTTTNDNGHVYVKYEDNAYYPAYIINYQGIDPSNNKNHRFPNQAGRDIYFNM
ncbi:hypothetical protein NQ315_009557 [Exocentrus adspersus]|uniref:Poly [ADP-ribose] polymerase n=1 Tax=Exocentrus adspersus TaxID=1586481 RepID=A0AAV8WHT8_9CUCU|nr:hypothetical protein NQ315_009557 [Exocentrus adspersus]